MSPLIHRSLTWSIVVAVVSTAAWLAGSVQQAHERRELQAHVPVRLSGASLTTPVPAMPAPHAMALPGAPEAKGQVQMTANKR